MKKQGFTLIELMVVVVIIGILAAVAVPKLFGMIAKSKASEVGPAAGTYVKLQQAYYSESTAIGGWTLIGYTGPGTSSAANSSYTTNFTYSGSLQGNATSASDNGTNTAGWQATSRVALNNCSLGSAWSIDDVLSSSEVSFTANVPTGSADCKALTPTFDKIGK